MQQDGLNKKITTSHLKRDAYLYVRQSTLKQVLENTESTKRQYALRDRAVALGWPFEKVVVIDEDLGQSGAKANHREGFQKLVADVGMGKAGIVMGLEVSRLARNSSDWHRLLEICALSQTLILDEDGIYDPGHFNDRLLLGLKGTMSEAELHILRARLRGGILNQAKRGELKLPLPVGFVYDHQDKCVLDPDKQVRQSVALFFETFRRTGSAFKTARYFRDQNIQFPALIRKGPRKGEMFWKDLTHSRALHLLHNPRYAGAFVFGKLQLRFDESGKKTIHRLPRADWHTVIPESHPGYITWDEFERHQEALLANASAFGRERRKSPPREGPALLQGLVLCGICGKRMTVRYERSARRKNARYVCQREGIERAEKKICQSVPGTEIEPAVADLLIQTMTPVSLEVAISVQQELQFRLDEADSIRKKQVERARYESDLARQRFMRVDPNNRLVADSLEADWNEKLRALSESQAAYEKQTAADLKSLDEAKKAEILKLATDFPKLWRDQSLPDRERKRIVRLLLEDVTLIRGEQMQITAHVRFKGGVTRTLEFGRPKAAWELRQTDPAVIREIDQLTSDHTDQEIAELLNNMSVKSGEGLPFTRKRVYVLKREYNLESRYGRLRRTGLLTRREISIRLKVTEGTIKNWRRAGLLRGTPYNDKNGFLYDPPGKDAPIKGKWKKPGIRSKKQETPTQSTKEKQYA